MTVKTLFSANDGLNGYELWITDGTAAGTALLKDLRPAAGASSNPRELTALGNGKVLFQANDGTSGTELWVTDGTAAGTLLTLDINPGSGNAAPTGIVSLGNGKALFSAFSATSGRELWVTDGTAANTVSVTDFINPGTASSTPTNITLLGNGKALFEAYDVAHGRELWVTDGTAANTTFVTDINPFVAGINPGTADSNASGFTALGNGQVVFEANDDVHGSELWVTDGTALGTHIVADINPLTSGAPLNVPIGSNPSYFAALGNGKALFQANDGTHGNELWVTDGTAAGTALVADIAAGAAASNPRSVTSLGNGIAVFVANDGVHGNELWVTNGTAAGTSLVMDIRPGTLGSAPASFAALGNGTALFMANDGAHGYELWSTDGTAAHTALVKNISPGFGNSLPFGITPIGGGKAVFEANDGVHANELWITDGTAAGTSLVSDINPAGGSYPGGFVRDTVCFAAGTRIATPDGLVRVEALAAGDTVLTHAGETRPIRWIGQRYLDLSRHPMPERAQPIRILANAFAEGQPGCDLRLSPDHAVFQDGMLIPVRLLVNGASIRREDDCRAVTYFHVELDTHDLLVAEGLPTESYLDTGNRSFFANGGAPLQLHPDLSGQAQREAQSCYKFAADAARVQPVWQHLAIRSAALGHALPEPPQTTEDPDLCIMLGERCVRAVIADGRRHVFALPASDLAVRLVSRSDIPSEARSWIDDRRRLGVMLNRLSVRIGEEVQAIPLDHPAFAKGWWDAEWHGPAALRRWTDGEACLPIALDRPVLLEIEVGATLSYRLDSAAPLPRTVSLAA